MNKSLQKWNNSFSEGKDYTPIDELLFAKIISILKGKNSSFDNIIDLGCGTGQSLLLASKYYKQLVGLDFSHVAIDKTKKRLVKLKNKKEFYIVDLNNMSELKNKLDNKKISLILSKLLIAFIKDKYVFLKECGDLLDKNACFLLITPVKNNNEKYSPLIDKISVNLLELEQNLNSLFSEVILIDRKHFEKNAILHTYLCFK